MTTKSLKRPAARTACGPLLSSFVALVTLCVAIPSVALSQTAYPGGKWEPGPVKFGTSEVTEKTVTMDDGAVLVARVTYPTDLKTGAQASGRFPVIVEHTPYDRPTPAGPAAYFNSYGYIYAAVRARGTGKSTGEAQYSSPRDGRDGKLIADWASATLESADGRVAMVGCSYPAAIALTGAAHMGKNSPVKAIVASCNGFHSQNRGTFMRAGLLNSNYPTMRRSMGSLLGDTESAKKLFDDLPNSIDAGGTDAYDSPFWQERLNMSLAADIAATGIPVLLWSGWQDRVEGAVRAYTALQNASAGRAVGLPMAAGQQTTPRYQLIMGDWGHAEGLDLGVYLQWIEAWLKGVDTGIQNTSTPMHVSDPGTGGWVNIGRFPQANTSKRWHLAANGALTAAVPARAGSERVSQTAPTEAGGKISFSTPPFANGTTLSGAISATIYASSNRENLILIGRAYDVAPDGSETLISLGAIVGSLRELDAERSWTDAQGTVTWPWPKLERDQYLTPGQVYRFDISLLSRQWSVKPNHRVRLDIATQSPAELCAGGATGRSRGMDPCYLTPQQKRTTEGGVYSIMRGGRWPSALNLPEIPYGSISEVRTAVPPTVSEQREGRPAVKYALPIEWGE